MTALVASPVTIEGQPSVTPAEDFDALKKQALYWLPRWSQGHWSDFNDHDPGIMILEQVLYASTELPYRAGLSIPQLLDQGQGQIPWDDNSLYSPTKILPMQPLTANDYARLLYDQIPELVYACVTPLISGPTIVASNVAGRLCVAVAVNPDFNAPPPPQLLGADGVEGERQPDPEGFSAFEAKVSSLLASHCNLGERFETVTLLAPTFVAVQVELQILPGADPNLVAGNLYLAAKRALLPGPRFRTLAEATQAGTTMDEALSGPLLQRGVIADDDLPELWSWPEARARVAQALLAVDDIQAISRIAFPDESTLATLSPGQLFAPATVVGITAIPASSSTAGASSRPGFRITFSDPASPATNQNLSVANDSTALIINSGGANRHVQFARLLPNNDAILPPHPGLPSTTVSEYFSIQNHFPPCFALHHAGLPRDVNVGRRAQVRQLRGYLMVFEQFMANYLAQLGRTADFFSNRTQEHTIFVQPLTTVPDVLPLVDNLNADTPATDPAGDARVAENYWINYLTDRANPYRRGLHAATETEVLFLQRRHRVLDHLLSRFNENFSEGDHATFETIVNKQNLLQQYRELGNRRAQAANADSSTAALQIRPRSGLEEKIQLLLRRDSQSAPGRPPETTEETLPSDFYFLIEPIRFLPRADDVGRGASWSVPVSTFQSSLVHVFINWTFQPLSSAFVDYAEARVRENAPAHLWHRFIWLETRGKPNEATEARAFREKALEQFLTLWRAWAASDYAPLQLAPAPESASAETPAPVSPANTPVPLPTAINVCAGTPAADLFAWLPWLQDTLPPPPASVRPPTLPVPPPDAVPVGPSIHPSVPPLAPDEAPPMPPAPESPPT